jgi:hypothetical protein
MLRLFVLVWAMTALFLNPAGNVMSNSILLAADSLWSRHEFALPEDPAWQPALMDLARGESGRMYSGLAPGATLVALPAVPFARALAKIWPASWPRQMRVATSPSSTGIEVPELLFFLHLAATLLLVGPLAGLCAALVYKMAATLAEGPRQFCALTVALGGPLFAQSTTYSKETILAALFMLAFLGARARPLLSGLGAGAAVLIDYKAALFVVPIWLYASLDSRRAMVRFFLGALVFTAVAALYNQLLFGAPWHTPYQSRAGRLAEFQNMSLGGTFSLKTLFFLLFHPVIGVFVYHSFLLPSVSAVISRWRRADAAQLLALASLAMPLLLLSFATHAFLWTGGILGTGARHLAPATVWISIVFAACLASERGFLRLSGYALGVLAILASLLCVAWGGLSFPDLEQWGRATLTREFVGNPLGDLLRVARERGLSSPLFRLITGSDSRAALYTAIALAVAIALYAVSGYRGLSRHEGLGRGAE